MRTINKRPPPNELVEWRQQRIAAADDVAMPFNYDAMRSNSDVVKAVELALFREQGGICAYTGIKLGFSTDTRPLFHIEHLKAQDHCQRGEDTDYRNLVACWPEPNFKGHVEYGANQKGAWPSPSEAGNFVSPLLANCTLRFVYRTKSQIAAARDDDTAAVETIRMLGLNFKELKARRREAIQGALKPKRGQQLNLAQARKIKTEMERAEVELNNGGHVLLRAFCFAIKPFIDREVGKLEGIRNSRPNN